MKITLLCENAASAMPWRAEWGFSAFIEIDGLRVLFDAGLSDAWRFNADHAGIDLETTDIVALSHIHRDHTKGLLHHPFQSKKPILLHPRVLEPPPTISDDKGAAEDYACIQRVIRRDFEVMTCRDPVEFRPGAFFLGEIPRRTRFEAGGYKEDPMPDDTALAFRTEHGVVVISGCAHAGICNICEHAKNVTGERLYAVVGGFHLMAEEDPPVEQTIAWFKAEAVPVLLPMHCIDFDIQARFHLELGTRRLAAGDAIEL